MSPFEHFSESPMPSVVHMIELRDLRVARLDYAFFGIVPASL